MKLPTILSLATIALAAVYPKLGAAESPVTSNLMVPLELTVEGNDEAILISGTLHIVAQLHQASLLQDAPASLEVHTNLVNTTAVGLSTGATSPVASSQSIRLLMTGEVEDQGASMMWILMSVMADNERQAVGEDKKLQFEQQLLLAQLQFSNLGILTAIDFRDVLAPCD